MNIKNLVYILTALTFSIIIGAAVYEHLAVWPRAYAAPPASLSMFQGKYGLQADAFWKMIHPITLLLFFITLFLSWKTLRWKNVLIPFIGYIIILLLTFIYFVPELIAITTTTYHDTVDPSLQNRGAMWTYLSIIRLAFLIVLAVQFLIGLTKSEQKVR